MLQSDVFLNILKYLDVYRWPKYINLNKKMRGALFQKIELIRIYFRKKQYPKLIPLYWLTEDDILRCKYSRYVYITLMPDEYKFYRDLYQKKYGRQLDIGISSDNKFLIEDENYDEELFLELYQKKGIGAWEFYSSPLCVEEIPYEYYLNGCYKLKKKNECEYDQGGVNIATHEHLKLLPDKLKLIKYKYIIKSLQKEIEKLKTK